MNSKDGFKFQGQITKSRKMNSAYLIIGIAVAVVAGITIAMSFTTEEDETLTELVQEEYDEIFAIGTVSDDAAKMIKRYQPTADYIAENLSGEKKYKGKVIITQTIDDMEDLLLNQEIDLYYDSPFGVVYLTEETGAKVIAKRWKENSASYNSVCFVKRDSEIQSMRELPGKTLVFQSLESTTGYMLPMTKLLEKGYRIGFDMKNDINYIFSGDDENTAHWVLEGKGDAGVISNLDFMDLPDDLRDEFRIIWETQSVPRQLVALKSSASPEMTENVKEILLSMHESEVGLEILEEFKHTSRYSDFNSEEEYQDIVNMLKSLPPGIID